MAKPRIVDAKDSPTPFATNRAETGHRQARIRADPVHVESSGDQRAVATPTRRVTGRPSSAARDRAWVELRPRERKSILRLALAADYLDAAHQLVTSN